MPETAGGVKSVQLRQHWRLLRTYVGPQWRKALLLGVLLLGGGGLALLSPQILRRFIDAAVGGGAQDELTRAALLFIGVAVLRQAALALTAYVGESTGWAATNMLRADLAAHCLRLNISFHKAHTPGELIERVDGDVTALANFFSRFVVHVVGNAVLLVGVLAVLFSESWLVGLPLTVFAVVALVALNRIQRSAVPFWAKARQASADLFGFLEERLAGIDDIRSSGAGPHTVRALRGLMRELLQRYRKARVAGNLTFITTNASYVVGEAIGLGIGAYLFLRGSITIGTVYLILHYINIMSRPLEELTGQVQDLQRASASVGRVEELFAARDAVEDGPGCRFPAGPLAVEFDDVCFGYDEDRAVLKNVSFRLQPGRTLAILGRTGSGKTSLVRLLLRFHDPDAGVVRLGGVDLRQARLSDLRRHIGMVTQEVQLFHTTVRDNLTFFDREIPDQKILHAIEQVGLRDWYWSLPDGLETRLDAGGGGLSAGEAQLLAFARVFLKNPGLVILDEASSRLDPSTEQLVGRATERLLENRTGIIITHRLATASHADEILILEDGRVSEHNLREQLADDPTSRFHQLHRLSLEGALR